VVNGPWASGDVNGLGGLDFGFGAGHAQGSTSGDGLSAGDGFTAGGVWDNIAGGGHLGAWREGSGAASEDRYGVTLGGRTLAGSGSLGYTGADGRGATLAGDIGGPSAGIDAWAGPGGFSLGAQANLVSGSITGGSTGTDRDELNRIGLSAGAGAAVRGSWNDSDGDGFREYGLGGDLEFLSVDLKTEDPLRTGIRQLGGLTPLGPLAGMAADAFMPEGNMTESAANEFGLTTRNANLDTTLDAARSLLPDLPGLPEMPSLPSMPDLEDLGSLVPDLGGVDVRTGGLGGLGGLLDEF
jgi:hypothetical protein